MPIRSYQCLKCKDTDTPQVLEDILEWGFNLREHECPVCGEIMTIMVGNTTFSTRPTGDTLKERQKKERFKKRNKRLEAMTPKQQEGFKRIIDRTGGKRYMP